jgi:hypothetical protein
MSKIRKLHNQVLIYFVLVLACIRVAVARALPSGSRDTVTGLEAPPTLNLDRSLLFQFVRPDGSEDTTPQYGLEITGVFPYVRLLSTSVSAAPVPIEVVPEAPTEFSELSDKSADYSLTQKVKPAADAPFCTTDSFGSNCEGGDCANCSPCTPTCVGGGGLVVGGQVVADTVCPIQS